MANPFLVETMTLAPNTCMCCGRGNTPDGVTGVVGPFADLGVDYNWGDSAYLCGDCIGKLAILFDWISPDTKKQLERQITKLKKDIHDLNADIDIRRTRERTAIRGARALGVEV